MTEFQDTAASDARTAAQIEADVGVEHVADVYAEALLGATENAGQTDAVLAEFDELLQGIFGRFPRLEAVLTSALVSDDDKVGIIDRVLAGRASPLVINFLKVVAGHGRLDLLRAIHRQAGLLRDKPFAGLLGYSGLLADPAAIKAGPSQKPPILLIHGEQDEMIPVGALFAATEGLSAADIPVAWHISKGIGHGIAPDGLELGADFLARVLR